MASSTSSSPRTAEKHSIALHRPPGSMELALKPEHTSWDAEVYAECLAANRERSRERLTAGSALSAPFAKELLTPEEQFPEGSCRTPCRTPPQRTSSDLAAKPTDFSEAFSSGVYEDSLQSAASDRSERAKSCLLSGGATPFAQSLDPEDHAMPALNRLSSRKLTPELTDKPTDGGDNWNSTTYASRREMLAAEKEARNRQALAYGALAPYGSEAGERMPQSNHVKLVRKVGLQDKITAGASCSFREARPARAGELAKITELMTDASRRLQQLELNRDAAADIRRRSQCGSLVLC